MLRPFYLDLFSLVARLEGGIKFLVDFRGGLLVGGREGGREGGGGGRGEGGGGGRGGEVGGGGGKVVKV